MRLRVSALVLVLASCVYGQSPDYRGPMRFPEDWGNPQVIQEANRSEKTKPPIKEKERQSVAWQMLLKSGHNGNQIRALYEVSGVKNFAEFVSAAVVAKNLNLELRHIMYSTRYASLSDVLKNKKIPEEKVKAEIKKAQAEAKRMLNESVPEPVSQSAHQP